MQILSEIALKHGTGAIVLLSHEELRDVFCEIKAKARNQDMNLPFYLSSDVKHLHFYLKNLEENGLLSFDVSFDYSSIDEEDFRRFSMHRIA